MNSSGLLPLIPHPPARDPVFASGLLAALVLGATTALAVGSSQGAAAQSTAAPQPAAAAPVVTPTSGLVTIESYRQLVDNSTGIVTAIGNVRIVYPDQRVVATARQAQYYSREGRVVLSGDVDVVQDDGHSIRAEKLVYLVDRERLEARPADGKQVITRYNLAAPPPGGATQ